MSLQLIQTINNYSYCIIFYLVGFTTILLSMLGRTNSQKRPRSETIITLYNNIFRNNTLEKLFNEYFDVFVIKNDGYNDINIDVEIDINSNYLKLRNLGIKIKMYYNERDDYFLLNEIVKPLFEKINSEYGNFNFCGWEINSDINWNAIISNNYNNNEQLKNSDLQFLYNEIQTIPILNHVFEAEFINRFVHYKLASSILKNIFSLNNKSNDNEELYTNLSQKLSTIFFIYCNRNHTNFTTQDDKINASLNCIKQLIEHNNKNNIYYKLYKFTIVLKAICQQYYNEVKCMTDHSFNLISYNGGGDYK